MRSFWFCTFLLLVGVASCSQEQNPEDIPFELMPDGLKKKIEAEVIGNMEEEAIEFMVQQDQYYRISLPTCDLMDYRNLFTLRRNDIGDVLIRDERGSLENVEGEVFLFYTANEHLNQKDVPYSISNPNYTFYNYPFYSFASRSFIDDKVLENATDLARAEEEGDKDYITFYQKELSNWKDKKQVIIALNADTLQEVHSFTEIEIDDKMNKKGLSPLTQKAILGMLELRNFISKKYFNKSYLELYFQAARYNNLKAINQLNAINFLCQIRITDFGYSDNHNLQRRFAFEPAIEIEITLP